MVRWGCFCWPNRCTPGRNLVANRFYVEVDGIHSYAAFMGYLSLAVRGLRFLVITWTTVVLLGGFVSLLKKEDFWSLTVVTLVQTAGIFDVVLHEKLSNMWNAFIGLLISTFVATIKKPPAGFSRSNAGLYILACGLLALAKLVIQALVFIIILCPLAVLYIFGLPISAGISLWRLIEHDYGNSGEAANLKPALNVLYWLAVVQGALFCYRASYAPAAKAVIKGVAKAYKFKDSENYLVRDYMNETRTGCEKNPSFARGRNLITYAVDQMDSRSPDNYISGVKILSRIIKNQKSGMDISFRRRSVILRKHVLIKHLLVGSASSAHTLHKLLWTLDSRSPYDIKTRKSAARIVAYIAGSIRLEQFPGGIQCIASLLGTYEECRLIEPYKIDWLLEQAYELDCPVKRYRELWPVKSEPLPEIFNKYKRLVRQSLRILGKLAASSEENCRVISNTPGLISRIMAPVTLDLLDNTHHSWYKIVTESLRVMGRLVTAAGHTGKQLRRQISNNKEVLKAIEITLERGRCGEFGKQLAMGILCQLYMDTSCSMDTESRKKYINILLYEFAYPDPEIGELAGEKLVTIASKNRSNAMAILKANDRVLDNLIAILLTHGESTYRIRAAEILEQLFIPYIEDNEHLNDPAKFITVVVPEVLREILPCQLTGKHTRAGAKNGRFAKSGTDIEGQDAGVSQKDDKNTTQVRKEQLDDRKLLVALLSLSVAILDKMVSNEQDLGVLFNAVAPGDDQFSLPRKLKEMVQRNSEHDTDCLKILKLISMMVISIMKHTSSFVNEELKDLLHKLFSVTEDMKALDGFTIIGSGDDGTRINKHSRTLISILHEAWDLVLARYANVDYIE